MEGARWNDPVEEDAREMEEVFDYYVQEPPPRSDRGGSESNVLKLTVTVFLIAVRALCLVQILVRSAARAEAIPST
jgi:hypothetical protein